MLRLSTYPLWRSPIRDALVATVNNGPLRLKRLKVTKLKPYHHGNLREALLQAAIRLIGEVGPTAFTLREVARRAGVSHNAPYRHFRAKEDLMAAVATEGYRELTDAMVRGAGKQSRALDRLKHAGLAYIEFALRRPEHFTVMFDAPYSGPSHFHSLDAAKQAFSALVGFVKSAQDEGQLASGDPVEFAYLAWTMVHGVAKLAITHRLPYRGKGAVLKFASFVIDQSLAIRSPAGSGSIAR
jgi:AcrR family transcriptional regulator